MSNIVDQVLEVLRGRAAEDIIRRSLDSVASEVSGLRIPVGIIAAYAGMTEPGGWIMCFGQNFGSAYPDLAKFLGSTIAPDLRGRVVVGLDNMGGTDAGRISAANALGAAGGEEFHTLVIGEAPSHNHLGASGGAIITTAAAVGGATGGNFNAWQAQEATDVKGGDQPHNNMQPYIVYNVIIKT